MYFLPANPWLEKSGTTIHKAATPEEFAGKAGLESAPFLEQVRAYNEAVRNGSRSRLTPPRSTEKHEAFAIENAPFYAFPAVAGITYTMGGISIDADARVLMPEGRAIAGLFAVGCATGGLEGGEKKGYVGGLVKSSVTGLRAAEAILAGT